MPSLRRVEVERVVELLQLRVRLPGGEAEPAAAHARELAGRSRVVRREDEPEARADDVERLVLVRQRLGVAELEPDLGRLGAGALEHPGRDVDAGHLRARGSGPNGHAAGSGGYVEPAFSRPRLEARHQLVVHGRVSLRHLFVLRQAPELGGPLCAQSCSFASVVSSLRARQSSGYISCLISFPSSSTGVPCVPTTSSPITRATTL